MEDPLYGENMRRAIYQKQKSGQGAIPCPFLFFYYTPHIIVEFQR